MFRWKKTKNWIVKTVVWGTCGCYEKESRGRSRSFQRGTACLSSKVDKGLLQGKVGRQRPKGGEGVGVSVRDKGVPGWRSRVKNVLEGLWMKQWQRDREVARATTVCHPGVETDAKDLGSCCCCQGTESYILSLSDWNVAPGCGEGSMAVSSQDFNLSSNLCCFFSIFLDSLSTF